VKGSYKEPLSTDFGAIPNTLGPLDPERRKNLDVCIRFLDLWHRFDVDGFAEMMTADGILETPYLGGERHVGPEEAKKAYYTTMTLFGEHDCLWLKMWTTNDPATFIYKSKSWNRVMFGPSKGNVYSNDYIVFMEVRGEKIARFSEYFNPTILMEAFDNNMDNMKIAEQEAAAFLSAQQNS